MDKTKKYLAFSFVMVLVAVTIVSVIGMILLDRKPVVLQGQIEATEIRISGKLPGRIDRFLVEEGERVAAGDTLVVINSPEALAKYEQVQALEDVAVYQNQKIDDGTRRQIVESMKQLWVKAKADGTEKYAAIYKWYKETIFDAYEKYGYVVDGFLIRTRPVAPTAGSSSTSPTRWRTRPTSPAISPRKRRRPTTTLKSSPLTRTRA